MLQILIYSFWHYSDRQNVDEDDFKLGDVDAPIDGTFLEHLCDQFPFCPPEQSRYRNIDGNCNNPNPAKSRWGAANSPMYVSFLIAVFFSFSIMDLFLGNDYCHQAMKMEYGDQGK